jgi:type I restriction enzyme, S subunit
MQPITDTSNPAVSAGPGAQNGLPPGWAKATIGELVARDGVFVDGDWVESKDQDPNGDVRLIQLADVGDGIYVNRSCRFLTSPKAAELRCTLLEPGDVLVARMPDPLGRACIFPGDKKRSVTVVDVCVVRSGSSGVNHRWLVWFINSPEFRARVACLQSGSTRKRISRGNLATIPLPVPPVFEQRRIVEEIEKQFTRLEAAVAALKRVQANLKRYRASVLKAACEGRLVPTEAELARAENRPYEPAAKLLARILKERRARWEADQLAKMQAAGKPPKDDKWKAKYKEPAAPDTSNPSALPEGWVWTSLEQSSWDASYGTSEKCDYQFSGPPVLRIPNIAKGDIDLQDLKHASPTILIAESDAVRPADFLVIRTNGSKDLIGRAALIKRQLDRPHFFASYLIRFRLVESAAGARWLATIWDASANRTEIERAAATSAGQYNLNIAKLDRLPLPVPPLAEQHRIVAEVERRLSVIDELEATVEANLKRAAGLRQAILKRAFEGKLVPQDPSDEAASVLLQRIRAERPKSAQGRAALKSVASQLTLDSR